jgi:hypothetical protein
MGILRVLRQHADKNSMNITSNPFVHRLTSVPASGANLLINGSIGEKIRSLDALHKETRDLHNARRRALIASGVTLVGGVVVGGMALIKHTIDRRNDAQDWLNLINKTGNGNGVDKDPATNDGALPVENVNPYEAETATVTVVQAKKAVAKKAVAKKAVAKKAVAKKAVAKKAVAKKAVAKKAVAKNVE